jgi:hypothetical protein
MNFLKSKGRVGQWKEKEKTHLNVWFGLG